MATIYTRFYATEGAFLNKKACGSCMHYGTLGKGLELAATDLDGRDLAIATVQADNGPTYSIMLVEGTVERICDTCGREDECGPCDNYDLWRPIC